MFLSLLILIVGAAYLYYRYNSVSDKSVFFKAPLFVTLAGSLTVLLAAILFVNLVAPRSADPTYVIVQRDTLNSEERDTSTLHLFSKAPAFHYKLLKKIVGDGYHADLFNHLEARYRQFSVSPDTRLSSIGNFCMGVIQIEKNDLDEAYQYLQNVPDRKMAYLHFCIGEIFLKQNKHGDAAEELRYQEDSLLYEDEVEVYFKVIPDMQFLRDRQPDKRQFPFYGWAYLALQSKVEVAEPAVMHRS